jgi:anthranilate phosphoribosyltransferase
VLDTCGTGGDGARTFNISTAVALVAAGAGACVAKHGNRAVSSACGSADVLQELGVRIDAPADRVGACLDQAGIGFLFAPVMHAAMRHAIGPRRQIGVRTVFNVLGPLTNPAGASRQLLGVYAAPLTERLAGVLRELGSERALVVHGSDGLDEITLTGPSYISELDRGRITSYRLEPQDLGLTPVSAESLKGGDAAHNAGILRRVLDGERGAPRDVVLLNAAAAILVAGLADSLPAGLERARDAVDSGRARAALDALVQVSNN